MSVLCNVQKKMKKIPLPKKLNVGVRARETSLLVKLLTLNPNLHASDNIN